MYDFSVLLSCAKAKKRLESRFCPCCSHTFFNFPQKTLEQRNTNFVVLLNLLQTGRVEAGGGRVEAGGLAEAGGRVEAPGSDPARQPFHAKRDSLSRVRPSPRICWISQTSGDWLRPMSAMRMTVLT